MGFINSCCTIQSEASQQRHCTSNPGIPLTESVATISEVVIASPVIDQVVEEESQKQEPVLEQPSEKKEELKEETPVEQPNEQE